MTPSAPAAPSLSRTPATPPGSSLSESHPRPQQMRRGMRRKQATTRRIVIGVIMAFFLIPLTSMLYFSVRYPLSGKWTGHSWSDLIHIQALAAEDPADYGQLWDGLKNSAVLVVLTVVLMLVLLIPTMTWIRLRVRWLSRTLEFVCLLPLTIPAIVLVVGLGPVYRIVSSVLSTNSIWLCFIYVILVLPFAYRALDAGLGAIDLPTLSEAARSLGAGWLRILWRIVLPNIRSAVVSACFISVALVLGEFTIAQLLARNNLQTGIYLVSQSDGQLAVTMSLAALLLAFVLLMVLSLLSGDRKSQEGS
ncbi:MAG: ABC transporter permease subunit [Nakamurella sp.]